jgi:hypothetical protein
VRLEDFVIARNKADAEAVAASDRRTQEFMSWARGAAIALMGLIANEAWKRWGDKIRRRKRDGAVDSKLDEMSATIGELRDNTNGRMDEMLKQERQAGLEAGRKKGKGL